MRSCVRFERLHSGRAIVSGRVTAMALECKPVDETQDAPLLHDFDEVVLRALDVHL